MNDVQKLSMCRICLVENVRMFVVANKNLQEIYEKLTDIPLLTKDRRPKLVCFLCFNRLKQCYQLQRKCLEAEKLFARILNEDYEAKPLLDRGHLEFSGYIISPVEQINISAECPAESGHVINENIPADCEGHDDNVELKEEHQSDSEQEIPVLEYLNIYSDREDLLPQLEPGLILPYHSESDSEDEAPLMEFKTEKEEEQEVSKKKRQAKKTTRAPDVNEPKLDSRRAKPEETVTTQLKNTKEPDSTIIQKTQSRTTEPVIEIKKCSSNSNDLNNHIRVHTGENPFKCDLCQRSFSKSSSLRRHIIVHTGEKPLKCDVCQRSFKHKSRLKTHMTVHTQNPYNCDVCQSSFSQKSSLTRHILVHTGELPYECKVCQHSFAKKCDLTRHSLVHTGEKPFKCDVCQRSFRERNKLTNHMRVHTGEKPFKCAICQRSFSERRRLTNHMRVHTGEKPFRCEVCHRRFSLKSNVRSHMRVHTGEKPYKCEICQRSFSDNTSLRKHLRLHTGEKPFKCEVCQLGFRYSGYLKRHKLQIHMTDSTS